MDERPPLLLSVDFEDWHQLVRRRVGASDWRAPGPALERQTEALLELLNRLGVRATFFLLGIAARAHPGVVKSIVASGHEIGCHGDAHLPVFKLTPDAFGADLRAACGTIEQLTGVQPRGFRAPAFSITRDARWAYEVLAEHGFAYDASEHDTPRVRDRARPTTRGPHPLVESMWELPVAVWPTSLGAIPVGGASYWAALPTTLVMRGLERAGPHAGLYLHPHEFDPEPLRAELGAVSAKQRARGALKAVRRNGARRRASTVLEAIAERFRLIPYGEAYAELSSGAGARPQPVSR